jgi:hypothetical protein
MALQIGKPGENRAKKNYGTIKKGKSVFRILPALGRLADKGVWRVFTEVIYGFENSQGYVRPFHSCEVKNFKKKMIEVRDPARDWIGKQEADLEQVTELLKKTPNSKPLKDKQKELLSLVGFDDGQFNVEKTWNVNAINLAGEVLCLKIGYKAMLAFMAERDRMKAEEEIDPVDIVGCFMEFNKTGDNRDTVVSVRPFEDKDETGAKRTRMHTIDEAELDKIEAGYFELDNLHTHPTQEEIQFMLDGYLAKDGGESVDTVMEKYRTGYEKNQPTQQKSQLTSPSAAPAKSATTPKSAPKPNRVEAVAEDNVADEPAETVELDSSLSLDEDAAEDTVLDVIRKNDKVQESLQADQASLTNATAKKEAAKPATRPTSPPKAPTGKAELSDAERQFMIDMGMDPDATA